MAVGHLLSYIHPAPAAISWPVPGLSPGVVWLYEERGWKMFFRCTIILLMSDMDFRRGI